MNRAGGWWRLWIFLSILWGVILFAIAIFRWPDHGEKLKLSQNELNLLASQTKNLFVKPATKRVPGRWVTSEVIESPEPLDLAKMFRQADLVSKGISVRPEEPKRPKTTTWYDTSPTEPMGAWVLMRSGQALYFWYAPDSTKASIEAINKAAEKDYESVQVRILKRMRWVHVGIYLSVWLSSCLSALLLAIGSMWVMRGFKGQSA